MTPGEREVWRLVRQTSLPTLVRVYREVVEAPHAGRPVEFVQAQRWVGLSIHGELFRRGIDPAVLDK